MEEKIQIEPTDALIVVDVQRDFCPGGALAVAGGDTVVPVINRLLPLFSVRVFTRDWHPAGHVSFSPDPKFVDKSWPPHSVQNTPGAEFHPALQVPEDALIISKGTDPTAEAYSGFQGTDLTEKLRGRGIRRVFVAGLATDYCVKATVLDALQQGFAAVVIEDGIKGVDVPPGTAEAALREMERAGARLIISTQLG